MHKTTARTGSRLAATIVGLCIALAAQAADRKTPEFLGTWTVNPELSAAVQPEHAGTRWWEGLGSFSTNVSVGGMPVPTGSSEPPRDGDAPPNPDMLRCQTLTIEATSSDELLLTYVDVDTEKLRRGKYRGMHSAWSRTRLDSDYESTSRKVDRSLELRDDGRLLMTVKLNPTKGKTRVFKRVFDRA
jgi:hypothetical protein